LGLILIGDQAINTMMVRLGMAWWYRRHDTTTKKSLRLIFGQQGSFGWQMPALAQQTKRAIAQTTVAYYS
jgi:hypothetical protein|tara:strand:+ start:357 stop:566 length:210 start_codon:yes stop_codon:yes gene_type:complete